MGHSHSSDNSNKTNNSENNNYDDNDYYQTDHDGGELPVEYFYEYRKRDRNNLDRTILLEISSKSFDNKRHQVRASTTLKQVKEIINRDIPLDPDNFILEVNKTTNYDDEKIVNDYLFGKCDVVMITIHDKSPIFQINFDTTDIKDQFTTLQKNTLQFRPYDRLKRAYQKVSEILNISSYRYNLKFNETIIPFTNENQLNNYFIDLNLTDGSAVIKVENLILPPTPDHDFTITVHFYEKKEKIKASRKNIVDDITFIDIFRFADIERIYFVIQGKGNVLNKNKTFEEQGVMNGCSIEAIFKLHHG